MRWLVLLLLNSVCLAQEAPHFQDIPVGVAAKEVEIPCTTWFPGGFVHCDAVVVGKVTDVSSQVHQSAAQVLPEESCVIHIESMFGTMPELRGATTVKLHARYIHDTYLQLEPDWGVYRHLQRGQRVMALIHRYEGGPAIGSEALILLNTATEKLPEILRRTQINPARFTDDDLVVWKVAQPLTYQDLADRVSYAREQQSLGDLSPREWLAFGGMVLILVMAMVWAGNKAWRRMRRR